MPGNVSPRTKHVDQLELSRSWAQRAKRHALITSIFGHRASRAGQSLRILRIIPLRFSWRLFSVLDLYSALGGSPHFFSVGRSTRAWSSRRFGWLALPRWRSARFASSIISPPFAARCATAIVVRASLTSSSPRHRGLAMLSLSLYALRAIDHLTAFGGSPCNHLIKRFVKNFSVKATNKWHTWCMIDTSFRCRRRRLFHHNEFDQVFSQTWFRATFLSYLKLSFRLIE